MGNAKRIEKRAKKRAKYAQSVQAGRCIKCGKPVSKTNHALCEEHRLLELEHKRKRTEYLLRNGRCAVCGEPLDENVHGTQCTKCTETIRMKRRLYWDGLMQRGLCVRCRKPNDSGARTCYACSAHAKFLALERKKRKENGAEKGDMRVKYELKTREKTDAGKELPYETKDLNALAKWANDKYTDFEIARTDYGTYYLKWHGFERKKHRRNYK